MEWNEDSFYVSSNRLALRACQAGKWAFVSDYERLKILHDHSGVDMDTDVEILKPLDQLLVHGDFTAFESQKYIPTAVMGFEEGNKWIEDLLSCYDGEAWFRAA